jgi:hypothetical protein
MLKQFAVLEQLIHIPPKLYVPGNTKIDRLLILLQGELAHRTVKRFYRMTNKINVARQIARRERQSTRLQRAQEAAMAPRQRGHIHHLQFSNNDPLPRTGMEQHHQISDSKNYPLNLFTFVNSPPNDPAKKVCYKTLAFALVLCSHFFLSGFYTKTQNPFAGPTFG